MGSGVLAEIEATFDTLDPVIEPIKRNLHPMHGLGVIHLIAADAYNGGIHLIQPVLDVPIVIVETLNVGSNGP
jgi:hypothetical protein